MLGSISRYTLVLLTIISMGGCFSENQSQLRVMTQASASGESDVKKSLIGGIHFRASLHDSDVVLNQPVSIDLSVSNTLERDISIDLGANFKEAFIFTVESPDGSAQTLPRLQSEGIARIGNVKIESGKTYTQEVILNEWFIPTIPGEYTVKIALSEYSKNWPSQSSQFGMKVKPEDTIRLNQIAKDLIDRINNSKTYGNAAKAALALTYVRNAVATPFLKDALLSGKMVESVIINSLRERGGREAVEVLIFARTQKPNSEISVHATAALNWIKHYTKDDKLKSEIMKHLRQDVSTRTIH